MVIRSDTWQAELSSANLGGKGQEAGRCELSFAGRAGGEAWVLV